MDVTKLNEDILKIASTNNTSATPLQRVRVSSKAKFEEKMLARIYIEDGGSTLSYSTLNRIFIQPKNLLVPKRREKNRVNRKISLTTFSYPQTFYISQHF